MHLNHILLVEITVAPPVLLNHVLLEEITVFYWESVPLPLCTYLAVCLMVRYGSDNIFQTSSISELGRIICLE
jgi:hypothetical protein